MPRALVVLLLLASGACAPVGGPNARWSASSQATICLNGAGRADHPGNLVVDALCAELPGLIEDCSRGACRPTFLATDVVGAEVALREVSLGLGDGDTLSVVGYSLGGINATILAARFSADAAVRAQRRRIDRLVLLDPFSPAASRPLDIPDGVRAAWVYRHSVAGPEDCSGDRAIGPYLGIRPRCAADQRCRDYDWSTVEAIADTVGHCTVTDLSVDAVVHNVRTGEDADDDIAPNLPAPTDVEVRARP